MTLATISDAIDSYLASGRTWALAALVIVAILLALWALLGKASLGKMLGLAITVILAFVIALWPQDLATQVKEDFDKRSNSMAPAEVVVDVDAAVAA